MGNKKNRYEKQNKVSKKTPLNVFRATDTDLYNDENLRMAREQIKAQSEALLRAKELEKKRAEIIQKLADMEKAAKRRSAVLEVAEKLKIERMRQQLMDERAKLLAEENSARETLKNKEYIGKFVQDLFVSAGENAKKMREAARVAPVTQAESVARDTLLNQQMLSRHALLDSEAKERLPSFFGTKKPAQSVGSQTQELVNGKLRTRTGKDISAKDTSSQFVSRNETPNDVATETTSAARVTPPKRATLFGAPKPTAAPAPVVGQQATAPKSPTSPSQSGIWQVVPAPQPSAPQPEEKKPEVSTFWRMLGY